ncbi:hypothetical protein ACFX2F_014725 [Malus domestica]
MSTFSLPDFPYDYGALEPVVSGEIMQIHHQKHHLAYITNYNKALDQGGGEHPHGNLGWAIDTNFGTFEALVQKISAEGAALQGSGWVWLGLAKQFNKLGVETTANQDLLVTKGASLVPLLGIDILGACTLLTGPYSPTMASNSQSFSQCAIWTPARGLRIRHADYTDRVRIEDENLHVGHVLQHQTEEKKKVRIYEDEARSGKEEEIGALPSI